MARNQWSTWSEYAIIPAHYYEQSPLSIPNSVKVELIKHLAQDTHSVYHEAMFRVPVAPNDQSVAECPLPFSREAPTDSESNLERHLHLTGRVKDGKALDIFVQHLGITTNIPRGQTDLITQINDATHHEEIFDILDLAKHQKIAKRLRYLHEITQDDDPEDPAMKFMSLRELALFFTGKGNPLPYPQIGISPDGSLQAEWHSSKASAVMKFLTDGNTRFAGTMDNQDSPQTIQGSGEKKYALQAILPFIKLFP